MHYHRGWEVTLIDHRERLFVVWTTCPGPGQPKSLTTLTHPSSRFGRGAEERLFFEQAELPPGGMVQGGRSSSSASAQSPPSGAGLVPTAHGQMDAELFSESSSASSASDYESDGSEEARLVEQETMLRLQQEARAQTQTEFGARPEDRAENVALEKQRAEAATKIQAIQRGKAARKHRHRRKEGMTEHQAAVLIQKMARGMLARARVFKMRMERFTMMEDPKVEGEAGGGEEEVVSSDSPKRVASNPRAGGALVDAVVKPSPQTLNPKFQALNP